MYLYIQGGWTNVVWGGLMAVWGGLVEVWGGFGCFNGPAGDYCSCPNP